MAKRFATADRFVAEVQRAFPHLLPYMQFDEHGWQAVEITLPATMAMTITMSLEDEAWCIAAGSYERLIPLDAADCEARFLMVLADYRDMREHVATYA